MGTGQTLRDTLEDRGDPGAPDAAPAALIRVGKLNAFHEDDAELIPLPATPTGEVELRRAKAHNTVWDGDRLLLDCADQWMSTPHAVITRGPEGYRIADRDSRNGVLVNGRKVATHSLSHGDLFVLGRTAWLFHGLALADPRKALARSRLPFGPTRSVTPGVLAAFDTLERVAPSDVSVLLQAETGAGKDVVARELHRRSGRPGAFVPVNCAALPESLIEAQLFGHRRGAFTGAIESSLGFVAAAARGTLFLDEIADMPLVAQAKLLRVIEDRAVVPLGETAPRAIDVRIVAASQIDLKEAAAAGRFRKDLYARLAQLSVVLPNVAGRRGDLGILAAHACGAAGARLTLAAGRAVLAYDWPLNIREIVGVVKAAAVLAGPGAEIDLRHLPGAWRQTARTLTGADASTPAASPKSANDRRPYAGPPREELEALLARHEGNVTTAAQELGKGKMQLYRWMERLNLDPGAFRPGAS